MSEKSYQENLLTGATGPQTETCLLASYDRISHNHDISTDTYLSYEEIRLEYAAAHRANPQYVPEDIRRKFNDVKDRFRQELGAETSKNTIELRVDTLDALQQSLAKLAIGGFRTAVYLDLGGLHAVGVNQIDDEHYDVKSTWSPFEDEPVAVSELFEYLDRCPRTKRRSTNSRTYKAANIVALPSEHRRTHISTDF